MDYAYVRELEQFLYREARMLDEGRFEDWLALFTDDIRYWMPMKSVRSGKAHESDRLELAFFDDNKGTLTLRVKRLATNFAFAEDPPSRTTRLLSNIELEAGAQDGEATARCNFLVYRNRLQSVENLYVGHREDLLRRSGEGWRIARRKVVIEQNVLNSSNLSIFF
jgi:3-phenylpropionate/cinnamic acid dioxygenase small subunit